MKAASYLVTGLLAAAVMTAAPALAQTNAAQVAIVEGDATGEYRALGAVSVTIHQRSLFPSKPVRQQIDEALRAEAAKLGADAVIQVKYDMSNAMTSRDGHRATGVAVRFARTAMAEAAPAPVAPAVAARAPDPNVEIVQGAPNIIVEMPAPPRAAPPAVAAAAPAPVITAPVVPASPAPSAPVAAAPRVSAPPAATPARPSATIVIAEQDLAGQPYVRLGEVSAVAHQRSLFPSTSPRVALQEALREEARKLGADAVIMVKYEMGNALTSRDGNRATGVAVRFTSSAPASASAVVAAAPAPSVAPPAPRVAAPAPAPAVVAAAPAPAPAAGAPRHAANPAMIVLAEQDLAGQRYVRIGEVSAVTHQRSLFPKTPARTELQNALRAEAHKLGADAVIMVKYDMSNAMTSRDGHRATGIAVRYE